MAKDRSIHVFRVTKYGTLIADGYEGPKTRGEAYYIGSNEFDNPDSLKDLTDMHSPVGWALVPLFLDWRDKKIDDLDGRVEEIDDSEENKSEIEGANTILKEFKRKWHEDFLDDADNIGEWLGVLSEEHFSVISSAMKVWASEAPDWEESQHITDPTSGQDAAFQWFGDGMFAEEAAELDIDIVEGDCPGSDYFAAELSTSIVEANKKAVTAGFNIRFIADGNNYDNL